MFAYCLNNPVNYIDLYGQDAILLQDKDAVYGFGHSGLLLEDRDGNWWHYYWGANRQGLSGKSKSGDILLRYYGSLDLSSINEFYKTNYGGTYEEFLYFKGNFSNSVLYAKALNNVLHNFLFYNLLVNNCAQTSLDLLGMGVFEKNDREYKLLFRKLRNTAIPNSIFTRISRFKDAADRYNNAPWYFKIVIPRPDIVLIWA